MFKWAGLIIREDDDKFGTATFHPTNPEHVRLILKHARPKRQHQIPKVAMCPGSCLTRLKRDRCSEIVTP